jgi:hypothetical protein
MVILFLFLILITCTSFCLSILFMYFYKQDSKKWTCIPDNSKYVIGRINNSNNAECMYDPNNVGCFIVEKENCNNFINNYPNVKYKNKNINLDLYTCGENSTNALLWNDTGYNQNNSCGKILNAKSIISYIRNLV